MADITRTAANVTPGSGTALKTAFFGETVGAGSPIYFDSAGKMWKAKANDTTKLDVRGVAGCSGSAGQQGSYIEKGLVGYGAGVFVAGMLYCLSINSGEIRPVSDCATGEYILPLGKAIDTATLDLQPMRLTQIQNQTAADVPSGADVT